MFIHKYTASGDTFYRISDQAKPGTTVVLETENWVARRQMGGAKVANAVKTLESAFAEKEEEPEKSKDENPKAEPPKEEAGKEAAIQRISDILRATAGAMNK